MDDTELKIVRIADGKGDLGKWGSVVLSGARSAEIAGSVTVPPDVAADLAFSGVVLRPASGHLIVLPHRGERIIAFDLDTGEALFEPITIPRDPDARLRLAAWRIRPRLGVAYLTENSMMMFGNSLLPLWREDDDFGGWEIET